MPNCLRHTQNITPLSRFLRDFLLHKRIVFVSIFYNFSFCLSTCLTGSLTTSYSMNTNPISSNECPSMQQESTGLTEKRLPIHNEQMPPFSPTRKKSPRETQNANPLTNAQFLPTRTKYHSSISIFERLFALQTNCFCIYFL